jgi:NADH:ubiquinone oxidoreductase subunit 2 (subunit N)
MSLLLSIFFSGFFIILSIILSIQENLKKLFIFTGILHISSFFLFFIYCILFRPIDSELIDLIAFYFFFLVGTLFGFFGIVLSMKRSGKKYPVKSIYDLAQLWLINRELTSYLVLLLASISGLPFFSGFLYRWFLIQEVYHIHRLFGIISILICLFVSYPYLRIITQMIFNNSLLLNDRGPRWYFDQLLDRRRRKILNISVILFVLINFKISLVWYFSFTLFF